MTKPSTKPLTPIMYRALVEAMRSAPDPVDAPVNGSPAVVAALAGRGLVEEFEGAMVLTSAGWLAAASAADRDPMSRLEVGQVVVYGGSLAEERGRRFVVVERRGGAYRLRDTEWQGFHLSQVTRRSMHPTGHRVELPEVE